MGTIIIQDGDIDVLQTLSLALELAGYAVKATSKLDEQFIDLISALHPDAVLLDYKLKGEDAKWACKAIRTLYPNLPLVATSCNSEISMRCQSYGFNACLIKPFDLNEMYGLIYQLAGSGNDKYVQ